MTGHCKCGRPSHTREFLARLLSSLADASAMGWDPLLTASYVTRYARLVAGECSECVDARFTQMLDARACESCDGAGKVNVSRDNAYAEYVDCHCSPNHKAVA